MRVGVRFLRCTEQEGEVSGAAVNVLPSAFQVRSTCLFLNQANRASFSKGASRTQIFNVQKTLILNDLNSGDGVNFYSVLCVGFRYFTCFTTFPL